MSVYILVDPHMKVQLKLHCYMWHPRVYISCVRNIRDMINGDSTIHGYDDMLLKVSPFLLTYE